MLYNYVDIGTSDFETSLDIRKHQDNILLIEPLFYYLKNLPDEESVYKANFAISDQRRFDKIYYVKESEIQRYGLPAWVRGCNSLGKRHVTIVNLLRDMSLPDTLISTQEVRVVTFKDIVELYDVTSIGQLKIDTEGHDHIILPGVIKLIKSSNITIERIICEYLAAFENKTALDDLTAELIALGYTKSQYGDNLILTKRP